MRPKCFLALLAVLVPFIAIAARSDSSVGAWQPLQSLKSPHLQEIRKFAVPQYNKQSGKDLNLEKAVKGETQIVAGINYRLVIEVKNGAKSERYQELTSFAARSKSSAVGGWQPIRNLKDLHVQEIANFAVNVYNKESGKDLKLEKIVKGEAQIVYGTNYQLVIEVKNGTKSERYQLVIYEQG
ncbi:cysteine proteinase inhibitor 1-like [Ziziphus jujuba]|uniref:Cysteine proteinase inhibitor 1-like n=1 Tax=Ziziphus jujuba TaxID=326968 RepID=A0ABM4AC45_ZIZJJ|nr:cysteine proteinase inhibitor 1-like [Ziziphus jujuba]